MEFLNRFITKYDFSIIFIKKFYKELTALIETWWKQGIAVLCVKSY